MVDGNKADVMFNVKTNDGSALNPGTEDEVPYISRDQFSDLKVTINGEKTIDASNEVYYGDDFLSQIRVDDGSDDTQAVIKVTVNAVTNGRIQITYSPNFDAAFSKTNEGIYLDASETQLATLIMKRRIECNEARIVSTSQCDMAFVCKTDDTTIEFDTDDNSKFSGAGQYSPLITMKNGTSFHAGNKNGGGWNIYSGEWETDWQLQTYIDPSEVASITWHGSVLYQAE